MKENNKHILTIVVGFLVIILDNIYGHYAPPFSITWEPAFLTIIIAGVNYPLYKKNFALTILYNFALLIFDDVLIRLYMDGAHDREGEGWIALFFILTYIAAVLTMIVYAFISVKVIDSKTRTNRIVTNLFIIITLAVSVFLTYWYYITTYGI